MWGGEGGEGGKEREGEGERRRGREGRKGRRGRGGEGRGGGEGPLFNDVTSDNKSPATDAGGTTLYLIPQEARLMHSTLAMYSTLSSR